jgi:hypothetical protein
MGAVDAGDTPLVRFSDVDQRYAITTPNPLCELAW